MQALNKTTDIAAEPRSGTANTMAVPDTARFTSSLDDLLNQSSREDITNLEDQVRSMFACKHRGLNDQYSAFLKLPSELKLQIGKLVLGPNNDNRFDPAGKTWFKRILPLLQTCIRLRTDLHALRFEPANLYYNYLALCGRTWQGLRNMLASWHSYGPHRGSVTIQINYLDQDSLSTAAALAGGLEWMLFGRLSDPPSVYAEIHGVATGIFLIHEITGTIFEEYVEQIRVGHSREKNMQACCGDTPDGEWRILSVEEGAHIWDQARQDGWE